MESFKNTLKSKWTKHITARRIRNLWSEYLKVADIKDAGIMTKKLNNFLDSFQDTYKELVESGQIKSIDLDKIFGDCSDILVALLDLVERESNKTKHGSAVDHHDDENLVYVVEIINKSLGVAELILHDEKYRVVVKETPNLINRILTLLDTLNTIENKKVLLRVISAIGENTENKLEIGRLEGFKKLLVLMHNDKELTQEILKTIKHFLDIKQQQQSISPGGGVTMIHGMQEDEILYMKKSLSMSSISEFARHKIGSVVSEGFKVIVGEFQKVFSPNDYDVHPSSKNHLGVLPNRNSTDIGSILDYSFIPSKDCIQQELDILNSPFINNNDITLGGEEQQQQQQTTTTISNIGIEIPNQQQQQQQTLLSQTPPTQLSTSFSSTTTTTTTTTTITTEEEILKEFMRVQGALAALTSSIQEAALTVQLDLLETISKLLYNNQKNQIEFRNMDGYSILIHLFDNIQDFNSTEGKEFLEDCFNLFFVIILDGNKSRRITNMDAFDLLFRILLNSSQTEVQLCSLTCIQDLISINPLNIVNIKHINGIEKLFQLLLILDKKKEQHKKQQQKQQESMEKKPLDSDQDTSSSENEIDSSSKQTNNQENLQSTITLLSDKIYHKTIIPSNLLPKFINLLNFIYEEYKLSTEEEEEKEEEVEEKEILYINHQQSCSYLSEKSLLMLELVFMYIKYSNTFDQFLKNHEGMKLLVQLVKHEMTDRNVIDLCFWMICHFLSIEEYPHSNVVVLIQLLEDTEISSESKEQLCYCISNMMHSTAIDNMTLKVKFQELGVLNSLISIVKNPTSPKSLVYAALVALCEVCFGCEENKRVLDSTGFMALSALVKSTQVEIDAYMFQLFVELAMNRKVPIRYETDYLKKSFSGQVYKIISNILSPQPQYTSILPHSKKHYDLFSYRSFQSSNRSSITINEHSQHIINQQLQQHQQQSQLPQQQHHHYGDEINLGDDNVEFSKDSPISSPSTTPIHSLANSHNGSLSLPPSSSNTAVYNAQLPSLVQQKLGIIRVPSFRNLFNGTRRNSIGSWAGSFDNLYGVSLTMTESEASVQQSPRDSSGSIGHYNSNSKPSMSSKGGPLLEYEEEKETLYPYTLLGKARLRSPDAALMLVDLLSQCPPSSQRHNLIFLMKILESNPQNKKMLCAAQGLKFLLYLSHISTEETQSYYSRLIVILGLYDISPSEVRLLFDLACFPSFESHPQLANQYNNGNNNSVQTISNPQTNTNNNNIRKEKIRKHELQMQVLYVIGTLTERKTPPLYFNFDGFDSCITTGQIDKFPSARSGYTFSCWIKTNYFLSDESGLFSWQDQNGNNIFEVFFKSLPIGKSSESKRYLCIQTRDYPSPPETFSFDKFSFTECGNWYHIAITHSKQKIALYIDGKFIQSYSTHNYPRLITKDKPISGCIGKRIYHQHHHQIPVTPPFLQTNGGNYSNYSSFNSLNSLMTTDSEVGVVGQSPAERGYFCGQMGTIHFFEGTWEAPACLKVFSRGNLYNSTYKSLGIDNREFLVIKPSSVTAHTAPEQQVIPNPISMSGDVFVLPPTNLQASSTNSSVLSTPTQTTAPSSNNGSTPSTITTSPSIVVNNNLTPTPSSPTSIIGRSPSFDNTNNEGIIPTILSMSNDLMTPPPLPPTTTTDISPKKIQILANETQGATIEITGGVNVHQTRCLKDVIKDVGGIHLCFPFLDMEPAQQVAGLRILAGLLNKSESNKSQFRELNGFAILYHLLYRFSSANPANRYSELSMETFEILFDLLLDGMNNSSDPKLLWSNDCLTLILDLMAYCSEEIQLHILKSLNNLLLNSSDTLKLWVNNVEQQPTISTSNTLPLTSKLNILLDTSLKLSTDSSFLLNILRKIVPHISIEDVESIFEFLLYNKDGTYEKLTTKAKILELVYEEMRKCPSLLEHLRSLGGFNIVFSLIEVPNEEIKICSIKLIGLLLHSNSKAASLFRRNSGFDVLSTLLSRYSPPSQSVCRALILLMVDDYKFDPKCVPETKQRSSSWISLDFFTRDKSSDSLSTLANSTQIENNNNEVDGTTSTDTEIENETGSLFSAGEKAVVYPEAFHALLVVLHSLYLIPGVSIEDIQSIILPVLSEFEKLLDSINMEILWNQPWFEWIYNFIDFSYINNNNNSSTIDQQQQQQLVQYHSFQLTKSNLVYSKLLSICKKMVIYDITKKTSKIIKLKEICIDYEEFYVDIVDTIISYFEKDYVLPANESTDIIKNLVTYYKSLEDIEVPPEISMRILNSINELAFHNTPAIRATMKSNGLLDIRDNLIILLLRGDATRNTFIDNFDFECVVDQKAFREYNNGLLYLLYFFHLSVNEPQLQLVLYLILKNVLGSSEENKKIISNILEDHQVISYFFEETDRVANSAHIMNNDEDQEIGAIEMIAGGDQQQQNQQHHNDQFSIGFIEWYYSEDVTPKRIDIETRIGKLLAPLETKLNTLQEKLAKLKEKRIKQRREKISKNLSSILKLVQETDDKRKSRSNKMIVQYSQKSQSIPIKSQDRLKLGQERWDFFKQKLWDSVLWNDDPNIDSGSKSILPFKLYQKNNQDLVNENN
eukprot:gene7664-9429_t